MPCVRLTGVINGYLSYAGEYRPGDPRPSGYTDWQEWAAVQEKAGLRQVTCGVCSRWKYPQELSGEVWRSTLLDRFGNPIEVESPVCLECLPKLSFGPEARP